MCLNYSILNLPIMAQKTNGEYDMLKDIKVTKEGDLVITMATNGNDPKTLPLSKSGKTKVVASTGGFTSITTKEFGIVKLNLNACINS